MIQHHNSALFIELLWGLNELIPGTFLVPQCLACSQRVQDVINSIISSLVITIVVDVSEVGKLRQSHQFLLSIAIWSWESIPQNQSHHNMISNCLSSHLSPSFIN